MAEKCTDAGVAIQDDGNFLEDMILNSNPIMEVRVLLYLFISCIFFCFISRARVRVCVHFVFPALVMVTVVEMALAFVR